jgi:hypothetical protein
MAWTLFPKGGSPDAQSTQIYIVNLLRLLVDFCEIRRIPDSHSGGAKNEVKIGANVLPIMFVGNYVNIFRKL